MATATATATAGVTETDTGGTGSSPSGPDREEGDVVTCPICIDSYTRARRARVTCLYCHKSACTRCCQGFLVGRVQASCMHCNSPWDREFVDSNFTYAFRNGAMKERRASDLVATEEALLPDTQQYARFTRVRMRHVQKLSTSNAELRDKRQALANLYCRWQGNGREGNGPYVWADEITAANNLVRHAVARRRLLKDRLSAFDRTAPGPGGGGGAGRGGAGAEGARETFLKRCPRDTCPGFLSTRHRCGICRVRVCADCLEVVDETVPLTVAPDGDASPLVPAPAEGDIVSEIETETGHAQGVTGPTPLPGEAKTHVCDPATVATVKLLLADTKGCPQCAVRIHKIDGCDQMWCTECKTAFSWRTMKIETGRIHNPHWYEWQRRTTHGEIPREPGDTAPGGDRGECGQRGAQTAAGRQDLMPRLEFLPAWKTPQEIWDVHRAVNHVMYVIMPWLQRAGVDENRNRDLRVAFLLGELSREAWKALLYRREKKRDKDVAIRQCLEMFTQASGDILWNMSLDPASQAAASAIEQLHEMRRYTNACLSTVSRRFGSKQTHTFDEGWMWI